MLGPLEVLLDGRPVPVPAGRGRVLLATLLLRANEFIPVNELVERVWDGEPPAPARAHKTLQTVVLRLRQALGEAGCVRTSSRGYGAFVEPGQLDLARFRDLVARGEHRAALELWRGPALGNVRSESLHREDVPRLVEEQLTALEHRIDADLDGATDVLVPELRSLVAKHPLHETFWAQLMLALHRAGQQAEALAVYRDVRKQLLDEVGSEPGQRLREAHEQVLRGEVPAARVVPRQLPPPHPHFVGREEELARLTETLRTRPGEPVLISAINGIGGVGKTVLAVEWAHQVAKRFPDGQLYVNLRGFGAGAESLDPAVVARDFLIALGVPAEDVPLGRAELFGAYRSAVAERRLLVLLDNARDGDHVLPLVSGATAGLMLVTSRTRISGLVAGGGEQLITLDVLGRQAAVELLVERIGEARVAAEREAVSRLVERCAGLPLALGIVAARAAYGEPLAALADELEQERLDALDIDDPSTDIRAVFSWSLRSVSEVAAEVFVLLGLHPGPDFSDAAVASLAALTPADAREVLDELVTSSLVTKTSDGRFVLHDLLRDYAVERSADLPQERRAEARERMFDHYLHTTWAARLLIDGLGRWTELPTPAPDTVVVPLADIKSAHRWYDTERKVLLGVATQMDAVGADDILWTFAYSMHIYLRRRGHVDESVDVQMRGLAAARRQGSLFGESRLNRSLASLHLKRQDFDAATRHLREALRCDEELQDTDGQVHVARGLAFMYEAQGRYAESLQVLEGVYSLGISLERVYEKFSYLTALGRASHLVGENDRALELCQEAHLLLGEINEPGSVMLSTLYETFGDIYLERGEHVPATESFETAVRIVRGIHDAYELAVVIVKLARARALAGDRRGARELALEALPLYESQRPAEVDEVRELIASLDQVCT